MIIYFTLIIPTIAVLVLLFWFHKKVTLGEYLALFFIPAIAIFIGKQIATSSTYSQEYLLNKVTKVSYYEPWNEYIHKTCTRTHCSGSGKSRSCYTTTYDCSYVSYHPECWTATLDNKEEVSISYAQYIGLKTRFHSSDVFVELNRRYHTQDGNRYDNEWQKDEASIQHYISLHEYEDKVRKGSTVFQFMELDEQDVAKFKLFEYPQITNNFGNYGFLVSKPFYISEIYNRIATESNALIAQQKQCKIWFLIFNDSQASMSGYMQEQLWRRGNKNEFVVCIGTDSLMKQVKWSNVFSWSDNKRAEIEVRHYLANYRNNKLPLKPIEVIHFVNTQVNTHWQRKSFEQFNMYLTIEPSNRSIIFITISTLLITLAISYYVITNEYDN